MTTRRERTLIVALIMSMFLTGIGVGYILADEKGDSFCSDIFSKINVDTMDVDVNITKMMDWMESRGYELGCKEHGE